MASNRVTPSPDQDRYPLETMAQQHYSDRQQLQKKDSFVIGGKNLTKNHVAWSTQSNMSNGVTLEN